MSSTFSHQLAPFKLGIVTFGVLIAALVSGPAVVPAHATTGDRTVTTTLKCTGDSCDGSVFWYQGGLTGTPLGSASISGPADSTTKGTTTQPAAADTLTFSVGEPSVYGCGRGFIQYFTPGRAINFKATVPSTDNDGDAICRAAGSTFRIQS